MRSIRSRDAFATLLAIACALTACREPYTHPRFRGAGHTNPQYGGTFRVAFDSDVRSLDPQLAYDEYSGTCNRLLYDTLVDYAPGGTRVVPSLATRWEVSSDGRVYTFHLRDDVYFHNGRRMVADDVRKSFERLLDPAQIPSPGTSFYRLLEGFDDYQSHHAQHIAGIVVLDPVTVQFRLTQPDLTFLNAMAMPFAAPIPIEATHLPGRETFSQHPIGTGPFVLERWEQGSRLIFRRNPHYWRHDAAFVDRIVLEISLARHLQFMRFQHGDLDHIHTLSMATADYVWIREQPAWRPYVHDTPEISMYGLIMNTEIPPWNNVHLRRAVAFALDRESICRSRANRIRPLGGVYPPGLPGYDPHVPGAHHYDLALARQEMRLAGYANGLPGEQEFWIEEGEAGLFYGQLIQSDLRAIGVNIRIHQATFAVYLEQTERRGAVPLMLGGWSEDFPDPSNFVETLFATRSIQEENSQNQAFYSNPRLDALMDRAHVETDPARRLAMYQDAERIVIDDAPWAFLYYPVRTTVNQPYVHGYIESPVYTHEWRSVWLDLPLQRYAARERSTYDAWHGLTPFALAWSRP